MTQDVFKSEFYVKPINDIRTRNLYNESFVHGTVAAAYALRRRAEQVDQRLAAELIAAADMVADLTPDDVPREILDPRLAT